MEKKATITIETIRSRLNQEIKLSGLSNTEIADKVGISRTMLSQYKGTAKMPSLENFARICEIIGCDANYVLGLTDNITQ